MALPLVISLDDLRDEFAGEGIGVYLSLLSDADAVLERAIRAAQEEVETDCEVYLTQRIIKTVPVAADLERGTDYDVAEEPYDFIRDEWQGYGTLQLRKRPIQSVERVAIRYGTADENAVGVINFPEGWISPEKHLGVLRILPIIGMSAAQASTLVILPLMQGLNMFRRGVFPMIVTVDYTAGFLPKTYSPNPESDDDPDGTIYDLDEACPDFPVRELLDAVRYLAAAKVLRRVQSQNDGEGGSVSVSGLSETIQVGRIKGLIDGYKAEALEIVQRFKVKSSTPHCWIV